VSYLPKNGRIWLKEGERRNKETGMLRHTGKFANWTDAMLDELCVFSGPGTTPHDDWVDSCVLGSTTTLMGDGTSRNISDVQVGDEVMTPLGPRRVLQAGPTGIKPVWRLEWTGGSLEATGNHPVWADGKWKRLDTLCQGSIMSEWRSQANQEFGSKSLSSTATDIVDTQIHRAPLIDDISVAQDIGFIAMCGNFIRGLFQKVTMFIITMTTPATTTYPTCAACQKANTTSDTGKGRVSEGSDLNRSNIWRVLGKKPKHGTVAQRVLSGIVSTLLRVSRSPDMQSLSPKRNGASVPVIGAAARIDSRANEVNSVVVRANPQNLGIDAVVYNLRVEEAECYYANGILVHNCSQAWRVFADLFLPNGIDKDIQVPTDERNAAEAILEPTSLVEEEREYHHDFRDGNVEEDGQRRGAYD
jgi:hypothetical protein